MKIGIYFSHSPGSNDTVLSRPYRDIRNERGEKVSPEKIPQMIEKGEIEGWYGCDEMTNSINWWMMLDQVPRLGDLNDCPFWDDLRMP